MTNDMPEGWSVEWSLLDDGEYGHTDFDTQTIRLDVRLTEQEARCTLAVELQRIARPWLTDEELEHVAACETITRDDLVMAWQLFNGDGEEMAAFLGVDYQLLHARTVKPPTI